MKQLDFIVMSAFAIFILLVGVIFARTGSDTKSFFAAGENAPWWINGLSLFMSFLSAGTFVVWGSIAYKQGFVAIVLQLAMCVGGLVTAFFIAGRWKNTGVLTASEYIGRRLGNRVQQFYTYLFLMLTLVSKGAILYPVGKMVYLSTPFSLNTCIVLLGIMIIIYTAAGGLWAVLVTDVLQFVILFGAVIIVLPLSFEYVGGIKSFISKAPDGFFNLLSGEFNLGFILAFSLYHIIYISGNWGFVQRYTSVSTEKDAKKVAYMFAGLYAISPFIWMLPPMIYKIINPNLQGLEAEGAYMLISQKILPTGLMGLMLAAMISATASTANAFLNLIAAVFTNDVYKKSIRPDAPEKELMKVARLATLGFGIITIGIALMVPMLGGIVEVVLGIASITGGPLLAPTVWTLFSKKQTGFSVFFTSIISLAIGCFFKFISPTLLDFKLDRASEFIVGMGVPLILLAIFEWIIYAKITHSYDYLNFLKTVKTKNEVSDSVIENEDRKKSAAQNLFGIRAISIGLFITGVGILSLGIISQVHIKLVGGVGLFIALLAIPVWTLAQKSKNAILHNFK